MNSRKRTLLLILLVLAVGLSGLASTGGSIAGTVADPNGGVMPGVLVVARNTETGAGAEGHHERRRILRLSRPAGGTL